MATTPSVVIEKLRDFFAPLVTSQASVQDSIREFISETAIAYRSSSIVSDHGGDGSLRAGDRMPDLDAGSHCKTLLSDWTEACFLAILLDVSDRDAFPSLASANVKRIFLRSEDFDDAGRHLLGSEPKIVILRPDGYVGYRGGAARGDELDEFLRQNRLN